MSVVSSRRVLLGVAAIIAATTSTRAIAGSLTPAVAARRAVRPPPPPPPSQSVFWSLETTPNSPTIALRQRAGFSLWLVARNGGGTTVDTQRDRLEWYVNGAQSMELAMAFGNGGRTQKWGALGSGETVREARQGEWLLPRAGRFVFSIRMNGVEVARRVVTVR